MSRELAAMKRLSTEKKISLKQARDLFAWRPCVRTLQNYPTKGRYVHLLGDRVYLEAFRSIHGWVTSVEAVERFNVRLNGGDA